MRVRTPVRLLLAVTLVASVSACATEAEPASSATAIAASATPQTAPTAEAANAQADSASQAPEASAACADPAFTATIPAPLADTGVPFYECAREASAMGTDSSHYVGEYDSLESADVVEAALAELFAGSDWELVSHTDEGDHVLFHAQKDGYSLYVALTASRMADAVTGIHYTLSAA